MTERLYYSDSYTKQFKAQIIENTEFEDHPALVLDKTYFYPTGGGQPYDIGTLNDIAVINVETRSEDQAVLHILASQPQAEEITGEILWERRFDHMQQHTGQHILSRAFEDLYDASTVGFHLSENSVTIDLNRTDLSEAELYKAEVLCNQIIAENRPIRTWFPEPDELADLPLRKISDKVTGAVRVVEVGDFDVCACGGTHVSQTGEIGQIKVIKLEKAKTKLRVEFRCGYRALDDYRTKNDLLLNLSSQMTIGYWEIGEAVGRLQEENKSLQKEVKGLRSRILRYEAEDIWQQAKAQSDTTRVIIADIWDDREVADLQGIVNVLIEKPQTLVVLAMSGEKAHIIFGASDDTKFDVVPLLKTALETIGVNRGGGRPNLAQSGGFPASRPQLEAVIQYARQRMSRD